MIHNQTSHDVAIPNRRAGWLLVFMFVLSALVLIALRSAPHLDVAISAAFFEETKCGVGPNAPGLNKFAPRCGTFFLANSAPFEFLRMAIWWCISISAFLVFARVVWLLLKRHAVSEASVKAPLVAMFSYLLGPALIANMILKEYWGRPRPATTFDFGSKLPYVLPGDMSKHCDTNCSFVSGEATAAFWLFSFVLFLPQKYRLTGSVLIGVLAIYVSVSRVKFGAHYFSDVMMSAMIALTSIVFAYWLFQTRFMTRRLEKLFR